MLYLTWCFNLQAEPLLPWLPESDLRRQFSLLRRDELFRLCSEADHNHRAQLSLVWWRNHYEPRTKTLLSFTSLPSTSRRNTGILRTDARSACRSRRRIGGLLLVSLTVAAQPNTNCVEFESSSIVFFISFPANTPIFNKRFLWCWYCVQEPKFHNFRTTK